MLFKPKPFSLFGSGVYAPRPLGSAPFWRPDDAVRPGDGAAHDGASPDISLTHLLLLTGAIFIVAALTVACAHSAKFVVTLWPASAVMLAPLLRCPRTLRNYAALFIGGGAAIGAADFLGNGLQASSFSAAADLVEVAAALMLLSAFKIGAANLMQFRNLLIFMAVAAGGAPILSASIGATEIAALRGIPLGELWGNWYLAHALGMIIIVPFLVSVTPDTWLAVRKRALEAAAVFVLVVAFAVCAAYFRFVLFLIVPAVLIATIRFGLIGATAAIIVVSLIAGGFVVLGIGEPLLTRPELSERILALQIIMAFMALWMLPTAALLAERDRLLADLSAANAHLTVESDRKSHLVVGLRRHLAMVEEQERLRLSHELHDQAGQGLIAAILELNEIDALAADPARGRLHQVRKKMEDLGKILHRIAWELRPPSIGELGLKKAVASYIADWSEQCGTEVDFHCDGQNLDDVPDEIGTAVYRMVQEGLTNVVKHANRPSDVSVVIRRANATLQVIIEDNGCGFDVAARNAAAGRAGGGLGLDGMRERLMLIGGTLEIESAPAVGTTIFARIALDEPRSAA